MVCICLACIHGSRKEYAKLGTYEDKSVLRIRYIGMFHESVWCTRSGRDVFICLTVTGLCAGEAKYHITVMHLDTLMIIIFNELVLGMKAARRTVPAWLSVIILPCRMDTAHSAQDPLPNVS